MPHANTGLSETSTTELATVVNLSDAIQDQKWRARRTPERVINGSTERGAAVRPGAPDGTALCSVLHSHPANAPVTGSTSVNRQNAIATAGAVAKRTIGPA